MSDSSDYLVAARTWASTILPLITAGSWVLQLYLLASLTEEAWFQRTGSTRFSKRSITATTLLMDCTNDSRIFQRLHKPRILKVDCSLMFVTQVAPFRLARERNGQVVAC